MLRCLVTLAVAVLVDLAGGGLDVLAADQLCRPVSPARAPRNGPSFPVFTPRLGMTVGDALSHGETPPERLLDLDSPEALCVGVGDAADTSPLAAYEAEPTAPRPRFRARAYAVQTRFGIHQLQVTHAPDRLLFPAVWASGTTPPAEDAGLASGGRFACYPVAKRGTQPMRNPRVPIVSTDVTLPQTLALLRPTRLCLAANVNGDDRGAVLRDKGLLCFATRVPATNRPRPGRQLLALRTMLDPAVVKAKASYELCLPFQAPDPTLPTPVATPLGVPTPVPTATIANPEPTATPDGSPGEPILVSIAIDPERAGLKPGESMTFTALGTFSDGSTRDVTEEVQWRCDYGYEYGCHASNEAGERGRVTALAVDDFATVWAADPTNDQVYGTSWLEVSLSPPPLLVYPYYNVIRQFDFDYLTALRLEDGAYRNATQDVVWSSDKPSVAVAGNPTGERSRIDGVGPGQAIITATDPATGNVSGPVTFDIYGPLTSLEVRAFGAGTSPLGSTILDVGDVAFAGAWGFFDYGVTFESLRGGVTLSSTAPAVASVVPREWLPRTIAHDLKAEAPGVTIVSAYDPLTGFDSGTHGCDLQVTVRNPAVLLRLQPAQREIGLDEIIHLTALGVAVDGTTRNLTQRTTYTSSNDAVVLPIPDPTIPDRSRLLAVGPGVAMITAISDPVFGKPQLTTTATTVATITVRNERVSRIVVEPSRRVTIPQTRPRFVARGYYPSGKSNVVTESVTWTSSNPDVTSSGPSTAARLAAYQVGTATITATLASGVSSHDTGDDATLVVRKPVKLSVVPASTTLTVGASVSITAHAQLSSGETIDLLDREITADPRWAPVFFRTSAPNVARSLGTCHAGDYLYPAQPVVAVAPGTATISATSWATDPPTESNAAGNATITVVP